MIHVLIGDVLSTAASGEDTVDHSIASETPRIEQLASILRAKPSMLVTFNKQDLQVSYNLLFYQGGYVFILFVCPSIPGKFLACY